MSSDEHFHETAWLTLLRHLQGRWTEIARRGAFDLSQVFGADVAAAALHVHLHFLKLFGARLQSDGVADLSWSLTNALATGSAHPNVCLLVASSKAPAGGLMSHDFSVSYLKARDTLQGALWTHLVHPIAVKVCYLRAGAPVLAPPNSHLWHPTRQRRVVKLSPYKGDVQPSVARRDLRI